MQPEEEQDYVWSFAVQAKTQDLVYEDPLAEMIRVFLEDFLNMGFLTCNGKRVSIDGFAFRNNPEELYQVFREVTPSIVNEGKLYDTNDDNDS